MNGSARRDRVFVGRFLSDDLGRPLIRRGIAVSVKNLCGVIAKKRVDLGTSVAPIGVEEVWQVLAQTNRRNTFTARRGLKQGVLVNREVVGLILP